MKIKSDEPLKIHLGCDFFRDRDGTLCSGPKKYIDKMIENYEKMFEEKPKKYSTPLEKNDHLELDDSTLLDADRISQYQSLIGCYNWLISLGRFDILTAFMTMSRFRVAPRQGHLDRLKRMCGYLRQSSNGAIRYRTEAPDYSGLPSQEFDWSRSIYGNVKEEIPGNIPEPLGEEVVSTSYVDANLYHDKLTGRSVTGTLHLINKTSVDWFSKRQGTVRTATYGSEFIAARTCIDQIIDLRLTL